MRLVLLLVAAVLVGGCFSFSYSSDSSRSSEPGVSVAVNRYDQNGIRNVQATLTDVRGPIDDWSDLDVDGCNAPAGGPIDLPHKFSGCAWNFSIRYAQTGAVLYSV